MLGVLVAFLQHEVARDWLLDRVGCRRQHLPPSKVHRHPCTQGQSFGGPAAMPPGTPLSEVLGGVQELLDVMVAQGYALGVSGCIVFYWCALHHQHAVCVKCRQGGKP